MKLNWNPKWDINEAIKKTVLWYKQDKGDNVFDLCYKQIKEYEKDEQ